MLVIKSYEAEQALASQKMENVTPKRNPQNLTIGITITTSYWLYTFK
jgi:hypothetical protein